MVGKWLNIIRKEDNIIRYQMEDKMKERTDSQHSYFVAIISYILAMWEERKFGQTINWKKVLAGPLFHDALEPLTGDINSGPKHKTVSMEKAVKEVENKYFDEVMSQLIPKSWNEEMKGYLLNPKDDTLEGKILEAADIIDTIFESKENVFYPYFKMVMQDSLEKLTRVDIQSVKYFMKYALEDLEIQDYYTPSVRKYIQDLRFSNEEFENKMWKENNVSKGEI